MKKSYSSSNEQSYRQSHLKPHPISELLHNSKAARLTQTLALLELSEKEQLQAMPQDCPPFDRHPRMKDCGRTLGCIQPPYESHRRLSETPAPRPRSIQRRTVQTHFPAPERHYRFPE
ncbi:hypothetical protein IGI04_009023 [Brassica rapa subsp. trilocularis]|uniref:Uncharacterized protein n=1 Tax=Brassica rapa subsp. trilocularis TaxID=1813537 RepID=A0ABQ7MW30_BRACM|nr:hypothetical protein IGI04_009023 [Brassica rapa subsp. trilocularis]